MPDCGSQIILCDIPIRFDTYKGCSHRCSYCFITRNNKGTNARVEVLERPGRLINFIEGKRGINTKWCDWDIPLHWGGMSDPFQPIEKEKRVSLECLKVFAETQYPFVVSTKGRLIADPEYLELIKKCNCVVQISLVSKLYNKYEKGAPSFDERLEMARAISPYKRVIIRIQPYMTQVFYDVLNNIKIFSEAGVYGVTVEGLKSWKKLPGMIKLAGDMVYPVEILKEQFKAIRRAAHNVGLKFYAGENRLRNMGDDLCCCGIDGLGYRVSTANFNHYLYDRENYKYTEKMKEKGTAGVFNAVMQTSSAVKFNADKSFKDIMELYTKSKSKIKIMLPED